MLATLKIKNVALIQDLTIQFENGLNIISGETGSGKSILLNSLGLCFGERGDKTLIRTGQEKLKASALFLNIPENIKNIIIDEFGIECEDEIVLDREIDKTGKSIARINGDITTTSNLKKLSSMLVDLHGQHEHQAIMSNDYQLKIIDNFAGNELAEQLIKLNENIDKINENNKIIKSLGGSQEEKQALLDLYKYNLEEIKNADIKENELETLIEKRNIYNASEKISNSLNEAKERLTGVSFGENAVEHTRISEKLLNNLSTYSDNFVEISKRLESVFYEMKDISENIEDAIAKVAFDQNEYDRIDTRIEKLKNLFKKFGGDYNSLKNYFEGLSNKISELENADEVFEKIKKENEILLKNINIYQEKITSIRKNSAKTMAEKIQYEIRKLGMPNAIVDVKFLTSNNDYTRNGIDEVDFLFSANIGFEPRSLSKIISGGEMSRFMLAYKTVVANIDEIDTLIFDEIDSGISGNIGENVAENLYNLSKNKQVIAITHLPTIASFADNHLFVEKFSDEETTHTIIKKLEYDEQVEEISRMLGAGHNSSEAKMLAEKLKSTANQKK